jgi:hypothetical protein
MFPVSLLPMSSVHTIEDKIFGRVQNVFNFAPTITLYDLTNTYMEGTAAENPKAKRGRSKEKRSDCPFAHPGPHA